MQKGRFESGEQTSIVQQTQIGPAEESQVILSQFLTTLLAFQTNHLSMEYFSLVMQVFNRIEYCRSLHSGRRDVWA